jgi:transposase
VSWSFDCREVVVGSIGLDVHRDFCEVAVREAGVTRSAGRVRTSPEQLEVFAQSLDRGDRVALEATGNAWAIAQLLIPHVAEVVLAHPKKLRAIAEAKVKTDKVDARVLAELLAADCLPRVWIGDELTRTLRRLVSRRRGLVKRRTQVKNEIQAVLHRNLKARPPVSDLFGKRGRDWLCAQVLPLDERLTIEGSLRQLDFLGGELEVVDRAIAESIVDDEDVRRLMTIPGVDVVTAATLRTVIGDVSRFPSPRRLVGYLGCTPRSASRGQGPPVTGAPRRRGRQPPDTCWSRRRGRQHVRQGRYERSPSASPRGVGATSPRSRSPAS